MKIVGISDVHCSYHYTTLLIDRALSIGVDLILLAGDVECIEPLETLVKSGIKIYGVAGNMDEVFIYRAMKSASVAIDGEVVDFKNITIAGVGAISLRTNLENVERRISEGGKRLDVLLSHHPLKGVNDFTYRGLHAGLKILRDFVDKHSPRIVIHGHIHEARGVSKYSGSLVINPGPLMYGFYSLIDIDDSIHAELYELA
ncbi:MAG: metallophosphoesterase family protein [Desulfurococcaceae archaeon]|nr:metallophosphoesterase family protein [Sulfolobales archaeon]MDW8170803.1 metallophosphoesterase family protein [Desulfurococcaceae archaeon]